MRLGWAGKAAIAASLPVVVGLAAFLLVTVDRLGRVTRESLEMSLLREAHGAARAVARGPWAPGEMQAWARRLGRETGARVTVIGEDGTVLADSDVEDVSGLENHGQRPEVVEARSKGSAIVPRHSKTVGRDLLYAGVRVPDSTSVVRMARDLDEAQQALRTASRTFWFVAVGVAGAGVLIAALLARGLARPLGELTAAAQRVEAGDFSARVYPRGRDEAARLGHAFNRMAGQLRETLARAEAEAARLAAVLEGMNEGVVAVDAQERISFVNGAARGILVLPPDAEIAGKRIYELVREPRILGLVQAAASGRGPVEAEISHDGPPRRLVQVRAAPVGTGVILVLRDMSRLRRLEQMRTDFVSNVSHELRTPLASIAAAVETLQDDAARADPVEGPRFVQMIQRNLRRLEALLDDILALSRLESRPETLPREPLDLAGVVRAACEELMERARQAGVALAVRAERSRVVGDAATLRRVVDNLVVNAITYTPRGGKVDVTLEPRDGSATLEVRDTGIGIPEEDRDRIFERFYRVDKARSRSAGGTGLGLAIVKHAVGLHGGVVEVRSKLARGSTFTVRIPLAAEPAPTGASDAGAPGETAA
ncbi:MAG: ATP-binding protein [Planctomycetes bacterium]|nr:ATP-binding protein [Planctomycetota bacterium]